jgi:hypothetical protein
VGTINRDALENIVGHISQIAVKHYLKVNNHPHTAGNTDDFYELLARLIDRGNLSMDKLRAASVDIEENGGKRIYLKKLEATNQLRNKSAFANHLRNKGLNLDDSQTASIKTPPEPTINYIFWSDHGIRIKATETHSKINFNTEKRTFIEEKVTNFALAILDFKSGFMQIRLDAPGEVHPHKSSYTGESDPQTYEDFYFDWFKELLDVKELPNYDISGVAECIVNTNPRIFRLPAELVRTGANSRQRYSCRGDVRDDPARQAAAAADSANWVYEDLRGYWIADESNGSLQRDVFMHLRRKPSMVRFLADCLAVEVDYALSRIRSLSN